MAIVNNGSLQTNLGSDGLGLVTGGTAINTGVTLATASPAIRAVVYSQMMMEEIEDGFLPDGIFRDVSEFSDGSQIQIPQVGNVTVSDVTEGTAATATAPDLSKLTLSINQYKGAMTAISDEMKQDSFLWMQIESGLPRKHLRAIKEVYEADMLNVAASQQVAATTAWATGAYGTAQTGVASAATINGVPHRFVAGGTANQFTLDDFISAKLAMDKANVPAEGRIAIVDPVVEATINSLIGANAFSNNQHWEGALETGFAKNMKFLGNIFGFDLYTSNRLATLGEEILGTFDNMYDGVVDVGDDLVTLGMKANLFMCVADEDVMPLMGAWRKTPSIEGDRNVGKRQDEFYSAARWGFGLQRPESLVVVASHATNY